MGGMEEGMEEGGQTKQTESRQRQRYKGQSKGTNARAAGVRGVAAAAAGLVLGCGDSQ